MQNSYIKGECFICEIKTVAIMVSSTTIAKIGRFSDCAIYKIKTIAIMDSFKPDIIMASLRVMTSSVR